MNESYRVLRDPDTERWMVVHVVASYTGKRGATRHLAALLDAALDRSVNGAEVGE